MTPARGAALLCVLALAGCPLPQPLPDYPPGTITPPRIIVDTIAHPETVVLVPENCTTTAPSYSLSATLSDVNTIEQVGARWFVNYDPVDPARRAPEQNNVIPGSEDPAQTQRAVPTFVFFPYGSWGTVGNTGGGSGRNAGAVEIVELVVSNGFDSTGDPPGSGAPLPFRSPSPGFETQLFRWVFVTVVPSTSVPCP